MRKRIVLPPPEKHEVREGPPPGGPPKPSARRPRTAYGKSEGGIGLEQGRVQGVCDGKGRQLRRSGHVGWRGKRRQQSHGEENGPWLPVLTDSGGKTVRYNAVGQASCATPHFNYRCVRRSREALLPVTTFYGSQAYKDTDAYDLLPYGCQRSLDPDSPDYSRVVFNNDSACELEGLRRRSASSTRNGSTGIG